MKTCQEQFNAAAPMVALTEAGVKAAQTWLESVGEFARLAASLNPVLRLAGDSKPHATCDIPPACWLPRSLGELDSRVCPGGTATARVRVTNCQTTNSTITVKFAETDLSTSVVTPSAVLQPMERHVFVASVTAPADDCIGRKFETLLWVFGCNSHYLRWTIEIGETQSTECPHIEVDDCPDYIHHWYDHFYCHRPCFGQGQRNG